MRHFVGFILAVIMAVALFFGAGWGVTRIIALHGPSGGLGPPHALTSLHGLLAVAAVTGTGLLLGILIAAPRVSPLAAGLPGLVLLGWSGLLVAHSAYALRYLPLAGSEYTAGLVYLLVRGILALIGAAMIIPLLVPSRWRRRYYEEDGGDEDFSVPAALGLVP